MEGRILARLEGRGPGLTLEQGHERVTAFRVILQGDPAGADGSAAEVVEDGGGAAPTRPLPQPPPWRPARPRGPRTGG